MAVIINLQSKRRTRRADLMPRSNRFFHIDAEGWFFHAREGVQGPFTNLADAERFLGAIIGAEDEQPPSAI